MVLGIAQCPCVTLSSDAASRLSKPMCYIVLWHAAWAQEVRVVGDDQLEREASLQCLNARLCAYVGCVSMCVCVCVSVRFPSLWNVTMPPLPLPLLSLGRAVPLPPPPNMLHISGTQAYMWEAPFLPSHQLRFFPSTAHAHCSVPFRIRTPTDRKN